MATVGVVTGAGSGMGKACAYRLTSEVDVLLLVDRNEQALSDSTGSLAGAYESTPIEALVLDVTDASGLVDLRSRVSDLGELRAVVHAAGVSPHMADWRQILTVNLVGTALVIDAVRPLVSAGTAVVCFASIAADISIGEVIPEALTALDQPLDPRFLDHVHAALGAPVEDTVAAYSWAKLGVRRLVQREAVRFGRVGARITSVSPGMIDTPMMRLETAALGTDHVLLEETPLRREGRADEVAAAVGFLISDQASFINGTDLIVDGGLVAALRFGPAGLPPNP
jgi:NAD(P)-dependent dehydrogenase (short-subunit alcohol dehydrogenase family)